MELSNPPLEVGQGFVKLFDIGLQSFDVAPARDVEHGENPLRISVDRSPSVDRGMQELLNRPKNGVLGQ